MSSKVKSSVALIPERRFPGFSGPWNHDPLSSALKEHKVKNAAGREVFSVSMESGIVNQIEHLGRSYAAADTSHYSVGHRFDVVYTKSPLKAFPFGIVKQCKFDGEVALSPLYGVFTPKNPHMGLMIEAYFEAPERAQAFLSPLCQKGAKNTLQITNATFLSGRMALPKEAGEQEKIADCLTSLDETIAAQACKVDALKRHKKGLMQQLFPSEGETQPHRRFPEFQDASNWGVETLGNVCDLYQPVTLSSSELSMTGECLVYGANGIIGTHNEYNHEDSEVAVTCRGATCGEVTITEPKSWITGNAMVVKPKTMKLRKDFISQYFKNHRLKNVISGSAQPQITRAGFAPLVVFFPPPPEQQRIAACLSSLDALITTEAQKLEAIKRHKRSLMQQLFPSAEEAEG